MRLLDDHRLTRATEHCQSGILRDQDGRQSERRERGQSHGGAWQAGRRQGDQGPVSVSCERREQLYHWY